MLSLRKTNKHALQAKNPYSICLVWQLLSCVLGCDKARDDSDIGLFIPPLNCEVNNVDKDSSKRVIFFF